MTEYAFRTPPPERPRLYNDPFPCPKCGLEVHRGGEIIRGYKFHSRCAEAVINGKSVSLPLFLQVTNDDGGGFVKNPFIAVIQDEAARRATPAPANRSPLPGSPCTGSDAPNATAKTTAWTTAKIPPWGNRPMTTVETQ